MSFGGIEIQGIELLLEAPAKVTRSIDLSDAVQVFPQILESSSVGSTTWWVAPRRPPGRAPRGR